MQLSIILNTRTFGLKDAMAVVLCNLTNSSELHLAPDYHGRRDNQFNVVLSMTTPMRILLGPQNIYRFCLA